MLRAVLKDSIVYTVPAVVARGLPLLLVPLYTRVLDPADFGSLELLLAFAGVATIAVAFEVSQGMARYVGAEPDAERRTVYASSAFWFAVICFTLFASIMAVSASTVSGLIMGRSGLEATFGLGIAYIWTNGLFTLLLNQFRWERRRRDFAAISLLMTLGTAGASVLLAYCIGWGLYGVLLGMVLGTFVALSAALWRLRNSIRLVFDYARLKQMLAFSLPLVASGVAVWVSLYADRTMLFHFLSVREVGVYGVAYRVATISGLAMVGIRGALMPIIYSRFEEPDTPGHLARIFRLFVACALTLSLGLSVFAAAVIRVLATEEYVGGAVVIVFLVPAVLLASMYVFAPGISLAKRTRSVVVIHVTGATVNLGLNLLLIPLLGMQGAALATMTGHLVVFVLYMAASQRLYPVPHRWWPIVFCAAVAFVLAWWLSPTEPGGAASLAVGGAAIIGVAVLCVATRLVFPSELRQAFAALGALRLS